jgi:hypothetical protein
MKPSGILLLCGMMIFSISSCRKFPEGPDISLRSKKARLVNKWKVEKVTVNGVDHTLSFLKANHTETYGKDGSFYMHTLGGGRTGEWEWQNGKTEVICRELQWQGQVIHYFFILRLTEKELHYRYTVEDSLWKDTWEFHMVPG